MNRQIEKSRELKELYKNTPAKVHPGFVVNSLVRRCRQNPRKHQRTPHKPVLNRIRQ